MFDLVRKLLGRKFRQSEVELLNDALDVGISGRNKAILGTKRAIGPRGVALIKRFEGCARLRRDGMVEAYPDPGTGAEPWTIGWGATGKEFDTDDRIGPGSVWTQAQCDARLATDLIAYAEEVSRAIGAAPTTQGQFDAMVSFHYNIGAIHRATLTRKHKVGDFASATAEFTRWNKAGGRVLKGLVNRRREEAQLYKES
ncbi:MAG: lysozyme [Erythrobacter sp.]|uniref:lysozyme n=1 Tax=Erythrobacter sp. TaxID=1042 RepID=UPI00326341B4